MMLLVMLNTRGSDTRNYWVTGLYLASGILNTRKHDASETAVN
jgi:hypothetical protein